MSRKIIGVTVGTTLPKPNFKQTDPTKGDYIRNKPDFEGLKTQVSTVSDLVGDAKVSEQITDAIGQLNKIYAQNEEPTDAQDGDIWLDLDEEALGASSSAVLYTKQTLTEEQKAQARENIGAVGGNANLTTAQIEALDGMFKVCAFTKADVSAEYSAFKTAFGITDDDSGADTHTHSYTSAVTTATTCTTAGVRTYTCSCGESYTESIPATGHNYVDGVCTVCGVADPDYEEEVTLSSISATYSGGDVTVGTAVTDLTGIVVTAHYSDGSTATVAGYTLSGTIAEGINTVTVSYGGKTTTFTVTGVAESGGEDAVQYGLYFPASYTPTLTFGGTDTVGTHQINKIELTIDLPSQTAGNKILLSNFGSNGGSGSTWFGFTSASVWVNPLGGTVTPDVPSAILGKGKKTITLEFTPALPSNWGEIALGWGSGSVGNPKFTFYEMKCYMDDVLMADFKPTATLGEIYESVNGITRTTSTTDGLSLVEVTE